MNSETEYKAIDAYMMRMDEVLFPLQSDELDVVRIAWLSQAVNMGLLRRLLKRRQGYSMEVSPNAAMIALKWTGQGDRVLRLEPNRPAIKLVYEAIEWSTCDENRPLANSVERLNDFFWKHLPSLVPQSPSSDIDQTSESGTMNEKSQLFILDKLVLGTFALSTRFSEIVLPQSLVTSELMGAQSRAISALLERRPIMGKRISGTVDYLDNFNYKWHFSRFGDELRSWLLGQVESPGNLARLTHTIPSWRRLAFVEHLIVLAICACCNQAFSGKQNSTSRYNLFRLTCLPLLANDLEYASLRPILQTLETHQNSVPLFIAKLKDVARSLKQPITTVIDPKWWRNDRPGYHSLESIPKLYIQVHTKKLQLSEDLHFESLVRELPARQPIAEGNTSFFPTVKEQEPTALPADPTEMGETNEPEMEVDAPGVQEMFKSSVENLADVQARAMVKWNSPVLTRCILNWVRRPIAFRDFARALDEIDKDAFRKLYRLSLPRELFGAYFAHAISALSLLASSCFEDGRQVLLSAKKDKGAAIVKKVVTGAGKGNRTTWLRDFRKAHAGVSARTDVLRKYIRQEETVSASMIIRQSNDLQESLDAFEKNYGPMVQSIVKKLVDNKASE
jgi:hypothetical protein